MSNYRDDIAALHERILRLEEELAEARGTAAAVATSRTQRCPFCAREMVAGELGADARFHRGATTDLRFRRDGGDEDEVDAVDRYPSPNSDWFCRDCSTVIVRGRFAS